MDFKKACKILEISQKHTDDCIKKAYFRQALKYHPDKYKLDNGEKFREIKEAYDFLNSGNPFFSHEETESSGEIIDYKELIKKCIRYFSPENNYIKLYGSDNIVYGKNKQINFYLKISGIWVSNGTQEYGLTFRFFIFNNQF